MVIEASSLVDKTRLKLLLMKHNSPFVCLVDPNINFLTSIKVQRTVLFNRKHPGLWETVLNRMWSNQPNLKITYNILFSTFLLKCDVSLQIFFNIFFLLFFLLHDTFFSKCCAIFFKISLFSLNIKVFFPKTLKTMFLKYSLFSVNITTFLQNITYFFSKYYNFFLWLWQLFLITLQLYFENIMTLQCSENSITFSCNIKGFFQNTFSQKI